MVMRGLILGYAPMSPILILLFPLVEGMLDLIVSDKNQMFSEIPKFHRFSSECSQKPGQTIQVLHNFIVSHTLGVLKLR